MEKAEEKIERCWAKLMNHYNVNHLCPSVDFTLKGTIAGQSIGGRHIKLNLGFVAKDAEDMLEQTVPHEVVHAWLTAIKHPSHVISAWGQRRSPHGREFMNVLSFLGGRMERTHNYDVSRVQTRTMRRWDYKCENCGKVFAMSTARHNKMSRGQQVRYHRPCGPEKGKLIRA
jgi:SprT protein